MNNKIDKIKLLVLIEFIAGMGLFLLFHLVKSPKFEVLSFLFLVVGLITEILLIVLRENDKRHREISISRILGTEAKNAFEYGEIGIIVYDEHNMVSWVSEFLENRGMRVTGLPIDKSFRNIDQLLKEEVESQIINFEKRKYEFVKNKDNRVLYVKDVTDYVKLKQKYQNETVVLGLLNLDNYEEEINSSDEQTNALININIRQKAINWLLDYKAVVRKLRTGRFLIVTTKQNLNKMIKSRFPILEEVKEEAEKLDVVVSASMAFCYGDESLSELDSSVNSLMEFVLSRGGDQVAVKKSGEEVEFYGSSSLASEKSSKVKARVMAQELRGVVSEASKLILVMHNDSDLDCLGSALALSKIVAAYDKQLYIVANGIKLEPLTKKIYDDNLMELIENHIFVNPTEAISLLDEDTLVVMVDHHNKAITSAPTVLKKAKKLAIIDHHRLMNDVSEDETIEFMYVEPSASSAVELLVELAQYQKERIEFTELEATIMYAGLLVDTEKLKTRCTSRTFEVCTALKRCDADTSLANSWLSDSIEDFSDKISIIKNMEVVDGNIAIAVGEETDIHSRTLLAQCADFLCSIQNVEASFVIGRVEKDIVSLSARSSGVINVQLIVEKMGGGGHFNAAGLQKEGTTIVQLKEELANAIEQYKLGGTNEGNTIS